MIRRAAVESTRELGDMQHGVMHDVVPARGHEGMTAARQARGQKHKEALACRTRAQSDKGRGSDLVDKCLMGDSAADAAAATDIAAAAVNAAVKGTRVFWECPLGVARVHAGGCDLGR